MKGRKRYLVAVVAAGLALIYAAAAFGAREVVRVGNLILVDNGGISPTKLPRHGRAPIDAELEAEIKTVDHSHPPALQSVHVEIDRTIELDPVGIPTCKVGKLVATSTSVAKRACGAAIVGSGTAEVDVSFPEQTRFSSRGPVVLFNGGVHGRTTKVLVHTYVNVPVPTAVIVVAKITHINHGPYGFVIDANIPKIAGGSGSVTKFNLHVGRKFTYKGKRKSFLSAGCPTGKWGTKGKATFADGSQLGILHIFRCTPDRRGG